jgi:putative transposase
MWNAFRIQRCVVFAYVIMPDHLHLLVQPTMKNISECMRSLKTNASRDINRYIHNAGPGTRVMSRERFSWQEKFYDHVIENDDDLINHVEYIRYTPLLANGGVQSGEPR